MTTTPVVVAPATIPAVVNHKDLLTESLFGATGLSFAAASTVAERLLADPDIAYAVRCYAMVVDAVVAEEDTKVAQRTEATA